jgi:threonyl-tRNA synthetase
MERFCGVLIEHFAGSFPTWLAPEQVRLLPMNDDLVPQAQEILSKLQSAGLRGSVDKHAAKLGAKIRNAENDKIPHMLVLGKREAEEGKVSVRSRANPEMDGPTTVEELLVKLCEEVATKALPRPKAQKENA